MSESPSFIVCEGHGTITVVEGGGSRLRSTRIHQHFKGVIAATTTPNENALILIQKSPAFNVKYEILVAPLFHEDIEIATTTARNFGQLHDAVQEIRSRIAVGDNESESFILVSHSDGFLERKRLRP